MKAVTAFLLFIITFLLPVGSYSQTDKQKAHDIAIEAIELMDNGKIEESLKMLDEAITLNPDEPDYKYEMGYAYYTSGKYKDAIKVLETIIEHKKATDRYYQLLGNSYDNDNNRKKAVETYDKGLKQFPNSGKLYLEKGVIYLTDKNYDEALTNFETGIKVDPSFPSNYYWAAKIYCSSTERVWGILYGEIFMNMERNSKRTAEISKLLYDTYLLAITPGDTSSIISFSKMATMSVDEKGGFKLPFTMMVYEPMMAIATAFHHDINLASLNSIRTTFLDLYFEKNFNKEYPNILFEFQKTLQEKGHLEAYNYWILMKGDEDAFSGWQNKNKEKWDQFVEWFSDDPLEVTANHKFHRMQY